MGLIVVLYKLCQHCGPSSPRRKYSSSTARADLQHVVCVSNLEMKQSLKSRRFDQNKRQVSASTPVTKSSDQYAQNIVVKNLQRTTHPSFRVFLAAIMDGYINKMDEAYRLRKIEHVTGLTGGSIWEVNQITFVAPVCICTSF